MRLLIATVCGIVTVFGGASASWAGLLQNKEDGGDKSNSLRSVGSATAATSAGQSRDSQNRDRQNHDRLRDRQPGRPVHQPFFKFDQTVLPFMAKPYRVPPDYPRMPPYAVTQRIYKRNRQAALDLQSKAAQQFSIGNWTDAVKLYQEALQEDPSNVACRKALAEGLVRKGNRAAKNSKWEEALDYLLQAEFIDRNHPTAARDADACLLRAGDGPRSVESWRNLAAKYEDRGLYQLESVCYRRCSEIVRKPTPDDLPGSNYLKTNLPIAAFQELVRAVAPSSPVNDRSVLQSCHRTLGFLLWDFATQARMSGNAPTADSRLSNASASFRRALAYDRNDLSSLYGLLSICTESLQYKPVATNFTMIGASYQILGEAARAKRAYTEVLKMEPLNLVAIQNVKLLEKESQAVAGNDPQATTGNRPDIPSNQLPVSNQSAIRNNQSPVIAGSAIPSNQSAVTASNQLAIPSNQSAIPSNLSAIPNNLSAISDDPSRTTSEYKEGKADLPLSTPITEKWALVVGISKFQDPKLNLLYSVNDARAVYDFLTTSGNFARDHVILLTDEQATRSKILALVGDKWLPRVARPDDLVVIYFSTHGSPAEMDIQGTSYLITHDTEPDNLYATGISMQDFARIIKTRAHAKRVVMILDCCHSGAADPAAKGLFREKGFDAAQLSQGTGHLVMCSSSPEERSWESQRYSGSVFTHHLIEALKKNGVKTRLGDAFPVIRTNVQEEVQRDRGVLQTPILKSQWRGDDLMMSAIPTDPRPALEIRGISKKTTAQEP